MSPIDADSLDLKRSEKLSLFPLKRDLHFSGISVVILSRVVPYPSDLFILFATSTCWSEKQACPESPMACIVSCFTVMCHLVSTYNGAIPVLHHIYNNRTDTILTLLHKAI